MEGSSSTSTDQLPESIFFTARKARIRSNTQGASSSSQPASSYYSARIHSIMARKSVLNTSQHDAEIEASKDHWTVVEPHYFTAATRMGTDSSTSEPMSALTESERLSLYEENLKEMQRLQEADPKSNFFRIGNDGLVLGRKIGEGGQAEIYEAGLTSFDEDEDFEWGSEDGANLYPAVLKVFKEGHSVSALQSNWPFSFNGVALPIDNALNWCNALEHGRLMDDGRFAFQMIRHWGDLRKFMDMRMELTGNRHPPFMMPDGNYHECCMLRIILNIVKGMRDLHSVGALHRALKASNVLITIGGLRCEHRDCRLDSMDWTHELHGVVSDYECSVGLWVPDIGEHLRYYKL